jgi:hypothetical protein
VVDVTDVYEYYDGIFHPRCLIDAMIARRELSPAARDLSTDEALSQFAETYAVTASDAGAFWVPRRGDAAIDDPHTGDRECSGCDRLLPHDVSVYLRPDPIEHATHFERPTARDVADLLREHRQMIADAGGWASRIPRDRLAAWEARKADLFARIRASQARASRDHGDDQIRGRSR